MRLNSRPGPGGEEPFDSFVPKLFDRRACECNLYGYRLQPARPRGPSVRGLRSTDRRLAGCIPQAWRGGKFPPTGLQARSGGVNETEQQTGVGRHNGNGRTVPTLVRG
jgi:hypothetical protein